MNCKWLVAVTNGPALDVKTNTNSSNEPEPNAEKETLSDSHEGDVEGSGVLRWLGPRCGDMSSRVCLRARSDGRPKTRRRTEI